MEELGLTALLVILAAGLILLAGLDIVFNNGENLGRIL
jgi:hypothetical protein